MNSVQNKRAIQGAFFIGEIFYFFDFFVSGIELSGFLHNLIHKLIAFKKSV